MSHLSRLLEASGACHARDRPRHPSSEPRAVEECPVPTQANASASSPSRIHQFTTCHTARKSLGLNVFCFINSSVSWDPCSWVEPSVETTGGPAPAPANSLPPGEQTRQLWVASDSTWLFVSARAYPALVHPSGVLFSGDHGTQVSCQSSPQVPCQYFHSAAGLDFWFEDMSRRVSGHWLNDASRTQLGPEWETCSVCTTIFLSEA